MHTNVLPLILAEDSAFNLLLYITYARYLHWNWFQDKEGYTTLPFPGLKFLPHNVIPWRVCFKNYIINLTPSNYSKNMSSCLDRSVPPLTSFIKASLMSDVFWKLEIIFFLFYFLLYVRDIFIWIWC